VARAREHVAPYSLGEPSTVRALFQQAGIGNVEILTKQGRARFPSLASWVHTDIKGWTLAEMIDDEQMALLLREARMALKPFVLDDGRVAFATPAHLVTTTKAASA
jgi:hypothetical protein